MAEYDDDDSTGPEEDAVDVRQMFLDWLTGHLATVELVVPQDGRKRFRGIVLGADAEVARLRLEDGTEEGFPRGNIRRAKLVLTDELIAATAADAKRN